MEDPFLDETMQDPDSEGETKYQWDEALQRHVIAMLISDKQFLLQARDLVKPTYFGNKAHQKACSIVFKFYDKYRILPAKTFMMEEIRVGLTDDKALPYYMGEINHLYEYFQPGLDSREYLTDKIRYFAKIQAAKKVFKETMEDISKNPESEETWDKVYEKWRVAMTVDVNFEIGTDYFLNLDERYKRMQDEDVIGDIFKTGMPSLDEELKFGGYKRGEVLGVVGDSGVGKCYGKGTKILMYDGSIKVVEDIKWGDVVMGDDGTPRKVTGCHYGTDNLYRVTPIKGDPYVVNSEHILCLKRSSEFMDKKGRCVNPRYQSSPFRKEDGVFEISVKDYLKQSDFFKSFMKGYRAECIPFSSKSVMIDPYILGLWLGDGTCRNTEFTNIDEVVIEALQSEAESRGLYLNKLESRKYGYSITSTDTGVGCGPGCNSFLNDLKHYNLLQNKHVPDDYRINNKNVRLRLLAGLLDSDGSKMHNCFDFVNKNKSIADSVVFIARSLGLAAYMSRCKKKSQDGTEGWYWRVCISGNTDRIPVRIEHKICSKRKQIKNVLKTGIKVECIGKGQYFGFETDGNHRYLLGDFTVVHNSVMLANIIATNLLRGHKGLYISCEISCEEVEDRLDAILTGCPVQRLVDYKDEVFDKLEGRMAVSRDETGNPIYFNSADMGGTLIIKKYAAGQLTTNMMQAYLNQLKFYDYKYDFVILDYLGEMKMMPNVKTYESMEFICRDFCGMAQTEGFFGATALQPNRSAKEAQVQGHIGQQHLADAFGVMRPLDACLMLNQNDNEASLHLGRGWVEKNRTGRKKFTFYLEFDPCSLRIKEITQDKYNDKRNKQEEQIHGEVEIDSVSDKSKPKPKSSTSEIDKIKEKKKKELEEKEKNGSTED